MFDRIYCFQLDIPTCGFNEGEKRKTAIYAFDLHLYEYLDKLFSFEANPRADVDLYLNNDMGGAIETMEFDIINVHIPAVSV